MLYCTYSYVCICVLWQGRTALADCPEFKLLIKSINQIKRLYMYYYADDTKLHCTDCGRLRVEAHVQLVLGYCGFVVHNCT